MRLRQSSTVARPQECHRLRVTSFAPHFGQVHSGGGVRFACSVEPFIDSSRWLIFYAFDA